MKLFFILSLILGCSMVKQYKNSDHYDRASGLFFNPHSEQAKGLWDVIRWQLTSKPSKWPKWIEIEDRTNFTQPQNEKEVKVSFAGHSSFYLQTKNLSILTDPVWSHRVSPVTWAGPARHHAPGFKLSKIPKLDVVIISHNHYDHMDLATLKILNTKFAPLFLCPLGDKDLLISQGLTNVRELDWWETVDINQDKITFTPSQHFSGRGLFDRFESLWGSYVIEFDNKKIFFGGDTGHSPHFKEINKKIGAMDLSLIPIGAYAPRWFMQTVHMDPEEAVWAHQDLQSAKSIGIHFGTFQLTDEAIDEPEKKLRIFREKNQIPEEAFQTLKPGQSRNFKL